MKSNNVWDNSVAQIYLGDQFWFNLKLGGGWESETGIKSRQEWVNEYYNVV